MHYKREMGPELKDFLAGQGSVHFPLTLLRGFRPPNSSGFHVVDAQSQDDTFYKFLGDKDTSFPAQMRDAMAAGIFATGCMVIVTANSGIPCADAIRGFAEAVNIVPKGYDYVSPREGASERARLARVLELLNPSGVLVIDEFTETGDTLQRASRIVLKALKVNDIAIPIGAIAGRWYRSLTTGMSTDLALDFPRLDGRNFVEYQQVSLPELADTMNKTGRMAAVLLDMQSASLDERWQYISDQLTLT